MVPNEDAAMTLKIVDFSAGVPFIQLKYGNDFMCQYFFINPRHLNPVLPLRPVIFTISPL